MPFFDHAFDPAPLAPAGQRVELTTREVEDAGLLEILQTPGARLGSWSIFDALLNQATDDFVFSEPLGQSREIKVALSGLFGRFVARAYATRYLGFLYFATIHGNLMPIGVGGGYVRRIRDGDRPDWVANGTAGLAIIEAKGCHHYRDPAGALQRAFEQTGRCQIEIGGRVAPHKRFAIATRWGFSTPWPSRPMLWVKDPPEPGDDIEPEEGRRLRVGVARRHAASLLRALNQSDLAKTLNDLLFSSAENEIDLKASARKVLSSLNVRNIEIPNAPGLTREIVGSFVTRAGVVETSDLSPEDRVTLSRLKLAPAFVGMEREILARIIDGDLPNELTAVETAKLKQVGRDEGGPRTDGAGAWILRFDDDRERLI